MAFYFIDFAFNPYDVYNYCGDNHCNYVVVWEDQVRSKNRYRYRLFQDIRYSKRCLKANHVYKIAEFLGDQLVKQRKAELVQIKEEDQSVSIRFKETDKYINDRLYS